MDEEPDAKRARTSTPKGEDRLHLTPLLDAAVPTAPLAVKWHKKSIERAHFITPDAVAEWGKSVEPGRTNLLVFGPGQRNVCGAYRFTTVKDVKLHVPEPGTQYHLAINKTTMAPIPHGENAGMINDWSQNNVAALLQLPDVAMLLQMQYGKGYRIALDRHSARNKSIYADTPDKLRKTAHRDFKPNGTKETKATWRPPASVVLPDPVCVDTPPGSVSLALLNQSDYHAIPIGGCGFGVYVSAMAADHQPDYIRVWCARVVHELARGKTTPRIYVWSEFARLDPDDFDAMMLATVVYGLPPPVFPSGLPMNIPQPYAGAIFPHFSGVRPCAAKQLLDPAYELDLAFPLLQPKAFAALTRVATTLPGLWVASPAAVATAIALLI